MSRPGRRVTLYRFRATLRRRWGAYAGVVLLIGLLGGIAMGSIAAARRTQSSYPTFLASTNQSDLTFSSFGASSSPTATSKYSPQLTTRLAALPDVKKVESVIVPNIIPLTPKGTPDFAGGADVAAVSSVNGLLFDQDRVSPVAGRLADPKRADEMMMTANLARQLGFRVGSVVPFGLYTSAQINSPRFGTGAVPPRIRINVKLVGIVVFNNQIIEDDVDRSLGFIVFTPALTREALPFSTATIYGLQLDHGDADVAAVEAEFLRLIPPGATYNFHVASTVRAQAERATRPEAIAVGAFGAIAAAVAFVLAAQALARQVRATDEDRRVLRALGAPPRLVVADGLLGLLGAVVFGSLVAVGVAVALSPLAPLGPVRAVYPGSGIAFDTTVLGWGFLTLVLVLSAATIAVSIRAQPSLAHLSSDDGRWRSSSVARVAASTGVPVAGVVGVRFALEPGSGRARVPVRSALVGTIVAVTLVAATLTFASGLRTLVSHPRLYGWNWTYELSPSNNVPPQTLQLLSHDHDVAGWAGIDEANAQIDGHNVPILLATNQTGVGPPILSGHGLEGPKQIVLGAATLAQLHKRVGDTVVLSYGSPADGPVFVPPTKLRIVGTATMPAIGFSSFISDHPTMGTGALLSTGVEPPAFQRALLNPDPTLNGPNVVLVRFRPGLSTNAEETNIKAVTDASDRTLNADPKAAGGDVGSVGVQRPAEIVDYRTIGATPVFLAAGLAVGALIALALTLSASVRRRRGDLALLKTLGFTQRQLASTVAWQATIAALVGIIVGVPLGIALGRQLWFRFARSIYAVPDPTVPARSIVFVVIGTLAFANLAAAVPGRHAARIRPALGLRNP